MFKLIVDASGLTTLTRTLERAAIRAERGPAEAVNRTAGRVRAVLVPVLTAQTGLPKLTIVKAVRLRPASPAGASAVVYSRGGDVSLKYFRPSETGGGVAATVKGKLVVVRGGFITSGRAGQRVASPKLGGHVFVNAEGRRWYGHVRKIHSGVVIPAEMVAGQSLAAVNRVTARELPAEAARMIAKVLPGPVG